MSPGFTHSIWSLGKMERKTLFFLFIFKKVSFHLISRFLLFLRFATLKSVFFLCNPRYHVSPQLNCRFSSAVFCWLALLLPFFHVEFEGKSSNMIPCTSFVLSNVCGKRKKKNKKNTFIFLVFSTLSRG